MKARRNPNQTDPKTVWRKTKNHWWQLRTEKEPLWKIRIKKVKKLKDIAYADDFSKLQNSKFQETPYLTIHLHS